LKREPKVKDKPKSKRETKLVASKRGFRTMLRRHFVASAILGTCLIFCIASLGSIYWSLQVIAVTHTLRVAGILQAIEQSTPVKHDRGGVISNVFVTEGEVVREGQILASLNTDDLGDELNLARQQVANLLLRSRCVRALKENRGVLDVPDQLKQVLGQLQQSKVLYRETKSCRVALQKLAFETKQDNIELHAAQDLKVLFARLSQTNRLINDTGRQLNPFDEIQKETASDDLNFMRDVLQQQIKATQANVEFEALKARQDKDELDRIQALDRELEAISDQLVNAQSELTEMETVMRDKFIYATTSGRVQRMRIREAGRRIAAGAYVLEIAPLTTDFEVTSKINVAEAPNLGVGQLVHVQLSGGLPKPVWVPARIEKIIKTSENHRQLSIRLAREDLNKRDLLLGDHSLNGLGERSEAVISINSETAWESLSGTVKTIFHWASPGEDVNV
jgi:multidrug efflux pump subunit AcrA (membrane-fusion protein)